VDIELLNCPFCGSEAEVKESKSGYGLCHGFRVVCTGCHTSSLHVVYDWVYLLYRGKRDITLTKDEAEHEVAAMWNRRESATNA